MSRARVVLDWAGRQYDVDGEIVRIVDVADVVSREPTIPVRTLEVDLALDGALAWSRIHHPRTAYADVYIDDRLIFSERVDAMTPGRDGELTRVRIGAAVDERVSKIPATYDVRMRLVDIEATQRQNRAEDRRVRQSMDFAYYAAGSVGQVDLTITTDYQTIYADRVEGRSYPRVYGRPGRDGTAATAGLPIDSAEDILLVAGHHCTAGTVTIVGPKSGYLDDTATDTGTVYNTTDLNGRPIAVVDVSGLTALAHNWSSALGADEKEWYVRWDGTASGLPSDAVDVIADLLRHIPDMAIDWASLEAARPQLSGYVLDGTIDIESDAQAVLMQQILPLLPVRLVRSVQGIGLAPVRWDATARDARTQFIAGQNCDPVTRLQYGTSQGSGVVNQWTVRYAMSRRTKSAARSVQVGPSRHAEAMAGLHVHGLRADVLETAWVYSPQTAGLVAKYLVDTTCKDRLTVDVLVDPAVYGLGGIRELRVGDVVTYTDASESVSGSVALVARIERTGGAADLVGLVLV